MMPMLIWTITAVALPTCGWIVSAYFYKRRIEVLQLRIEAVRRTAAENAEQARRQIGQLQAELAARPGPPRSHGESGTEGAGRGAGEKPRLPEDGFPQTVLTMRPAGLSHARR
jgi:hypothetical protein